MKNYYITILLCFLTLTSVHGQTYGRKMVWCDCSNTQYAQAHAREIFYLHDMRAIMLCGVKIPDSDPKTYSEFILMQCGGTKIIDFYKAGPTYEIERNKDTLLVYQSLNLPTGNSFRFRETFWTIEKLYFSGDEIFRRLEVNRQIRKYSKSEIRTVLKTYEQAKPGIDEGKMQIANTLFLATISGDKKAAQYFQEFETKFGTLYGTFAEEYIRLTAMLELWRNHTISK